MRECFVCVTADDVGMAGYSTPEHVGNLLRFWESGGLKGTLFTVPRWEGVENAALPEYVRVLKDAVRCGHEVAQHGLDHGRFQTGIPPRMVLDLPHEGPAREYLATHRAEIDAALTVPSLREVLSTGRRILESGLGRPIAGFRAPCLSTCDALFEAIALEGYRFDSSHVFQSAAWDLINDPVTPVTPRPITRKRFESFRSGRGVRVWPISAEYTWYLRRAHYAAFLDLAKHDLDACMASGVPFVPVCHVSPVQEGDPDCGFDLYRDLLAHARRQAKAAGAQLVSLTLSELSDRWDSNPQ